MTAAALMLDAPRAGFDTVQGVIRYMLAGRARVTFVSRKTGERFTYRIRKAKDGTVYFVDVLTGPDNGADYTFFGTILSRHLGPALFRSSARSRIAPTALSVVAFRWAFGHIVQGRLPPDLDIYHEGRCGRCGRVLTVPESIASGLGPECAGRS